MHSGKRDYAPELIRGSQGHGCGRPAFEGTNKKSAARLVRPFSPTPLPHRILCGEEGPITGGNNTFYIAQWPPGV